MNNSIKFILFSIFLLSLPTYATDKDLYFYHLTPRDGLSQMSILSIYQDELGAIWFGTTEGLDRYNGQSIETIKPSANKDIKNNTIQEVIGDKSGALFLIAGEDLVRYDLHKQQLDVLKLKVDVIQYAHNKLWVAKDDSILILKPEINEFELYQKIDKLIGKVTSILPTNDGSIWIGNDSGLFKLNKNTTSTIIESESITYLFLDSNQNLWVGSKSNGVYVVSANGSVKNWRAESNSNSISDNQIRNIVEDNLGNIWIATFFGLNKYEPKADRWQHFVHDNTKSYSISHSSVYALLKDQQGTIWVGTYFGGVNYFNTETDTFNFYDAGVLNMSSTSFPYVGNMVEDKHNNLWVCTEGGQLICLNLKTREISKYQLRSGDKASERYNQKAIWYDQTKDMLYIGIHNGGLSIFDITTKQTKNIDSFYPISNAQRSSNNTVNHIEHYKGNLILLTSIGFIKMDLNTHQFSKLSDSNTLNKTIEEAKRLTFHIDQKNRLWFIGNGLVCIDLETHETKRYLYDENNPKSIGKCEINYIYESKNGSLYFSTMGSGIFKFNEVSHDFENYSSVKDGLISDFCYSISETPSGNLIFLHNKGISFVDPNNDINNKFKTSPNFPIIGFNIGSSVYTTVNDEIFVGGVNGLISFFESDLKKKNDVYSIYFDKLYVNNDIIRPNDDDNNILTNALPLTKEITLNHNQNNIRIEYAVSSYIQTITHNYEYRLVGFDKEWIPTNSNILSYTNLNPGKYTLEVREVGNTNKISSLVFVIKKPIYQTIPAYITYFILFLIFIYLIVRFLKWRTSLEESLKFEHLEKERIKDLNQMKLRFFTNVSHEFRTPLTLIVSYVDTLLMKQDLQQSVRNKVEKIARNANHLQNLITELLDFRKQEQGYFKLKIQKTDLVVYLKEIYSAFKDYAITKNIRFEFNSNINRIEVYIDTDYFKKAIYNILSNAFKYTPNGGAIYITIKHLEAKYVDIEIKDTGIGISNEYLEKIFDRFYQVEHRSSEVNYGTGTGIGLALTKEIVKNHHGTISVESAINNGSVFTVRLQIGNKHFKEEDIFEKNEIEEKPLLNDITMPLHENTEKIDNLEEENQNKETKPTLLVVDDNSAIVDVVAGAFYPYYNILKAYNGNEAFEFAKKENIDLIISDNIMPEMSGKELCYKIKNNIMTSHIPFVLLTAESADNQIAEGYLFGADSYVTKPFNINILISICNNLVKNRQKLYKKFKDNSTTTNTIEYSLNKDNDLIDRAIKIIKDNLNNPEFDMNMLGIELGYGRSKLYVKIKEVTGMTPNELTLNVKLKEAVFQLENYPQKNISQIAFELGFSSTKYFSRCFKSFYGITPQDWRKNHLESK